MTLLDAKEGEVYTIKDISTDDEEQPSENRNACSS